MHDTRLRACWCCAGLVASVWLVGGPWRGDAVGHCTMVRRPGLRALRVLSPHTKWRGAAPARRRRTLIHDSAAKLAGRPRDSELGAGRGHCACQGRRGLRRLRSARFPTSSRLALRAKALCARCRWSRRPHFESLLAVVVHPVLPWDGRVDRFDDPLLRLQGLHRHLACDHCYQRVILEGQSQNVGTEARIVDHLSVMMLYSVPRRSTSRTRSASVGEIGAATVDRCRERP